MLEAGDFDTVRITKVEDAQGNTKGWRCTINKSFSFMNRITVTITGKTRTEALGKAKLMVKNADDFYWEL